MKQMRDDPCSKLCLSIREAAARSRAEGLGVGESTIRGWIAEGKLPHRKVGKKILLYWPNLLAFLQGNDIPTETRAEAPVPGIHRVG